MKRRISACALTLALSLLALPLAARDYYLSPHGNDDAKGSRRAPWRTLEKVAATLEAGDTLTLADGEYPGVFAPAHSGSPGKPIVVRAENRRKAVLTGKEGAVPLQLNDRFHWTFQSIALIPTSDNSSWLRAANASHLTFRDCRMRRSLEYGAIFIEGSTHLRFIDNYLSADNPRGNLLYLLSCEDVVVEGNYFGRSGHCPLLLIGCPRVVVRANVLANEWGRCYSLNVCGPSLFEDNIVSRARDSAGSAGPTAKTLPVRGIYRYNRVYDSLGEPLSTNSYTPAVLGKPTGPLQGPYRMSDSRIYNNTIADNMDRAWQFSGIHVAGNLFLNNIFCGNGWAGDNTQIRITENVNTDTRFNHNIFYGNARGQATIRYMKESYTLDAIQKKMRVRYGTWSQFAWNIDAEPLFADRKNRDFRLAPGSPGIDDGRPLALAVGSGKGRVLPVTDGVCFFDGYGIEGQKGDWIAVGREDQLARIESIVHKVARPDLLTLDRDVAWNDADPVSLPWGAGAPDMGAYEHVGANPTRLAVVARPAEVAPGDEVKLAADPFGKKIERIQWALGNDALSNDLAPTVRYDEPGNYPIRVRARFANDESGVAVGLVRVIAPRRQGEPFVAVDFNEDTWGQWCKYFKFYRGHQTAYAWVDAQAAGAPASQGKCMEMTTDPKKLNRATAQIAPGAWDIDKWPIVRFKYRIPKGTPVMACLSPFTAKIGVAPWGYGIAATDIVPAEVRYIEQVENRTRLVDDDQWHEIVLDARAIRERAPDMQYVYRFHLHLNWPRDSHHRLWFDEFRIEAEKE